MFPRIILCCLFFFASGNRISNSQSVTSELYLLTQSPHHLNCLPWAPLRCNALREIAALFADLDPSQDWADTELPEPEERLCVPAESCDETETRAREVRTVSWVENTARGPEWDTIHLTHSLLLSQNKYSPLGSEKKLWYSSLPLVILEFSQKSIPVFVVSFFFLLVKSLDINLESKCSSILQQHLSGVQWTNPIATDWNFWLRNNPSVVLRMVDNWINIWLSKVHPLKRPTDRQSNRHYCHASGLGSDRMSQNAITLPEMEDEKQ